MIIIRPRGGLCNRIRAMDSAITLAKISNSKVHVIWEMNDECSSKFSDLFEFTVEKFQLTELNEGVEMVGVNARAPYIFSQYNNCYIDQSIPGRFLSKSDWLKIVEKFRHVYIFTYSRFFQLSARFSPVHFIPKPHLKEVIKSYRAKNMIGVHVRRSDHKEAIAYSPIEGFVKQMQHKIDAENDTKFFLATDDPSVEIKMEKTFPGRIISHKNNSLDRKDPVAIGDAVIDPFSLAACQKLIGSYWSTFSATAADINELERVTIREDNFSLKPFAKGEFSLLVTLNEKIQVGENDSGKLIVENASGEKVQLNDMSAAILNLCNQSMTVLEILNLFKQNYPAEANIVEENVIEMMEFLLAQEIIAVQLMDKKQASTSL